MRRNFFFLLFSLVAFGSYAQFQDDFSDGDFLTDPAWSGQTELFSVQNNELRLTAPAAAGNAYLALPSQAIENASWEFRVKLNFNPSSQNYARVYLASDQSNLSESLNGYFVMIGNTTDEVSLYAQTGTTRTKIIDGVDARVQTSPVNVRIKVTRDVDGNWELFSDVGAGYESEGTINNNTHVASTYFGVQCVYSQTNASNFSFDDFMISGDPYIDPAQPANYKDVIFSEVFPDPTPAMGLPEYEYIELYNRSDKTIRFSTLKLKRGSSEISLPNQLLQPGEYAILTSNTGANHFNASTVLGVTGFPSLTNAGDDIALINEFQVEIDRIRYTDTWYRDNEKKDGGWSLEIIDPNVTCVESENWTASEHETGGTPGFVNSVNANKPDLTGPKLVQVTAITSHQLEFVFNEKLESEEPEPDDFNFSPQVSIDHITFTNDFYTTLIVNLSEPIQSSQLYTVELNAVYDCSANEIHPEFNAATFALPEAAQPGDLVINEILFNPLPNGVDFVEIKNTSAKYINLRAWYIANVEDDTVANTKLIANQNVLLVPNAINAFTTNAAILKSHYPQTDEVNIIEVDQLPSFPDDSGTVALVTQSGEVMDYFFYNEDYHSVFLKEKEGVSLERIYTNRETNDAQNWKSANKQSGYATPGRENSNSIQQTQPQGELSVIPEIFEPVTGSPNFTEIHYAFDRGGYIATVKIFDMSGREVKNLVHNELLGTTGFFTWLGDRDDGTRATMGYYIIWFEAFDDRGAVKTFRKRVVVGTRF